MTLVMAIACGVAAANIYYNQPMLGIMEAAFPGRIAVTGLVPTATQLGFAAGLLLLVPLGDRFDRRRLILIQLAALTLSLAAAALAPDAWSLVVASALVGVTSSVAQQIVPFAAELAESSRRGATIGTVMSGLLCGILFGRALAGAVGDHYGWRAVFWLGSIPGGCGELVVGGSLAQNSAQDAGELRRPPEISGHPLAGRIGIATGDHHPGLSVRFVQRSLDHPGAATRRPIPPQRRNRRPVRHQRCGRRALCAYRREDRRLERSSYRHRTRQRHHAHVLGGFEVWGMIAGLIVGVILLDFGEQGALVSNQHVIYALRPEARNRLNTIFMGGMFVGGAVGSAGASLAWQFAGWAAVCTFGAALVAIALGLHACGRVVEKRVG
jgi:predicted MFS family arabinose efflux permease